MTPLYAIMRDYFPIIRDYFADYFTDYFTIILRLYAIILPIIRDYFTASAENGNVQTAILHPITKE
jgi:hypothetical protein